MMQPYCNLPALGYTVPMARLKAPQRREQLISVATKQFAKFGYDATTTGHIAKSAGVTEPILYRHFGSKQELFIAITREVSDQKPFAIGATDRPHRRPRRTAPRNRPANSPPISKKWATTYRVLHKRTVTTSRDRNGALRFLREHYHQMEAFFCTVIETA